MFENGKTWIIDKKVYFFATPEIAEPWQDYSTRKRQNQGLKSDFDAFSEPTLT